jgi:hypothetical protein
LEDEENNAPISLNRNEVVNDSMAPEWDILIEIQEAKKNLPGIKLEYVKATNIAPILLIRFHYWRN